MAWSWNYKLNKCFPPLSCLVTAEEKLEHSPGRGSGTVCPIILPPPGNAAWNSRPCQEEPRVGGAVGTMPCSGDFEAGDGKPSLFVLMGVPLGGAVLDGLRKTWPDLVGSLSSPVNGLILPALQAQ